jgi:hypothetical protein
MQLSWTWFLATCFSEEKRRHTYLVYLADQGHYLLQRVFRESNFHERIDATQGFNHPPQKKTVAVAAEHLVTYGIHI